MVSKSIIENYVRYINLCLRFELVDKGDGW